MIQEQHDESVIGGDSKVKFHKGEFTNSNLTIVILLIRVRPFEVFRCLNLIGSFDLPIICYFCCLKFLSNKITTKKTTTRI